MKSRSNPFLRSAALAAITLAASASSAFAVNGWWNTTDGNWDNVNNWWTTVGGTTIVGSVPTAGQTIVFNGTGVNGNQNVYLNGNRAGSTLTFTNTGVTSLVGGIAGTPANDTLTLSGGITVSAGAGRVNLGVNTTATTLTLSNTDVTTLSGATVSAVRFRWATAARSSSPTPTRWQGPPPASPGQPTPAQRSGWRIMLPSTT